jgi:hypothetical protein
MLSEVGQLSDWSGFALLLSGQASVPDSILGGQAVSDVPAGALANDGTLVPSRGAGQRNGGAYLYGCVLAPSARRVKRARLGTYCADATSIDDRPAVN